MRICKDHWDMCRCAVTDKGMEALACKTSEAAHEQMVNELNGADVRDNFDPLISMHWHFMNGALRCGGLYLMGQSEDGSNDGHYCPLCEFAKNVPDYDPKTEIDRVGDQMATWCRDQGLIGKVA